MFGVWHRQLCAWWMDTRLADPLNSAAWTTDRQLARRFYHQEDAEHAAFVEIPEPFRDVEAVTFATAETVSA